MPCEPKSKQVDLRPFPAELLEQLRHPRSITEFALEVQQ